MRLAEPKISKRRSSGGGLPVFRKRDKGCGAWQVALHSSSVPLEGSTGEITYEIRIPPNLFITGAINIDEPTNTLSDKILDRSVLIDMSGVDLAGFLDQLPGRFPELAESVAECRPVLESLYSILAPSGQGFGYRMAEEFVRYHRSRPGILDASRRRSSMSRWYRRRS